MKNTDLTLQKQELQPLEDSKGPKCENEFRVGVNANKIIPLKHWIPAGRPDTFHPTNLSEYNYLHCKVLLLYMQDVSCTGSLTKYSERIFFRSTSNVSREPFWVTPSATPLQERHLKKLPPCPPGHISHPCCEMLTC